IRPVTDAETACSTLSDGRLTGSVVCSYDVPEPPPHSKKYSASAPPAGSPLPLSVASVSSRPEAASVLAIGFGAGGVVNDCGPPEMLSAAPKSRTSSKWYSVFGERPLTGRDTGWLVKSTTPREVGGLECSVTLVL